MFPNQNNVAASGPGPAADGQQSLNYNGLPAQQPQQQQQLPQSTKNVRKKPYVKITEQPAGKALRFRYECEGRSAGSIPGVNSTPENKTYPTIEIVGYKGRAVVVVSCVTKDTPYRPHPHNLVGKEGCKKGVCTLEINSETMRAVFSNLGIQCVKKKDIEAALKAREEIRVDPFKSGFTHRFQPSSIDLNSVRLCFQVFMESEQKGRFTSPLPPVVSEPIFDKKAMSDLVICRLCSCSATVLGNTQIILLCEKVAKEDISVRFFEEKNGQSVWEAFGDFQHTDVHKQTAITFKTPRYHTLDITEPAKVFIQLRRPSDGVTSEALPFEYVPMDSGKHTFWNLHRHLKRKPDEDLFQQILRLDAKREVQAPTIEVIDLDTPKIEVQPRLTLDLDFNQEESQPEEPSSEQEQYTQEQSVQQEQYVQQEQQEEQSFQLDEPMQQEQSLQQEQPAQQSLEQTSDHLPDHITDNLPEDMEAADAQAEAEAHRLRSEQEKEIDTIIDEKVRELEQLELGQQLEPRPLSANDKITEWMKSSEIEQQGHEPSPTGDADVLDSALEITRSDKTLDELLETVAELDEIYTDFKVQRDTYNNTIQNELLAGMEGRAPLQVEDSFDDAATYTSLQIAFKNPVLIPMEDIMPPTPPMSQCAPEDAHQHYDPVEVNSQANKPETPLRPVPPAPPAILTVPFPPEEEKLPPLPPKRIRKQDNNVENRSIEANTVPARPATAESPLNKRLPPAPKNPNFNTLPRQKKPGFFSKLFSRRKSKPDLAQGQENSSLLDSKATSREPSIGHFNMQDPMRASLRSSKSAAPFISSPPQAKSSPVKAKRPGSKLTKPVGRSVSSVSGKRPGYLNADVVHIPLKGDSANSLPQHHRNEGYSQSSTISMGGLDRRTASALQLADIPISEGGMELVAIADRQSLHNLVSSIEGHFNVQLDPNLDLTEAEHFALYTSIPPIAAASEFDETSAYYAPVDAGEILTPDEVARRLAAANGL
ncbi:embryonic polarity protein dorsal isoform X1 [Drosophila subpulchrella]|uniref:embryonic polarity protein dorsal isoform X1 n=1 Tax=Drosophila subpulchrella TaxID=1486046 RepID=UPI0018A1A277|nr:embryonic polarity protein dorsal isoform X1 [Drosophila subpulchrella]XP_037708199.1 embryonic polarity protein dorsal isoform X1 [Drosophila subpulchrella]XP_037708200.1 embryonic polarity protein dorsal isoform X1 [Drosophila subpulchrella]XP_037708201.1 embryonic polarity protein dorsal isoform X1 [Drosophila subpulchrella]XP_037708203.1 embryonic polarity protein dorsal isoform X1 [Drosophila subpulchrella]XP_037708204.1 embryonic polarity protein dorsal isoform X1 [Drosophila subpulch